MQNFSFPAIHNFPPFFTLQPNPDTQTRQIQLWTDLILSYCRHHGIIRVDLHEWEASSPVCRNVTIQRNLSLSALQTIFEDLVKQGKAEWFAGKKQAYVWWRRPEEWAKQIANWAFERGLNVCTLMEIQEAPEFEMLDKGVLTLVLDVLVKQGKAQLFSGSDASEMGVKFA